MNASDASDLVQQGFDSKFNSTAATWVQPSPTSTPNIIFPTAHLPAFLANLINFHYEGRDRVWYRNKYLNPDGTEKPLPKHSNLSSTQIFAKYGKYWEEVGLEWNLRYALSSYSAQDQILALQTWKFCSKTKFVFAANDPYVTGITVAGLNRKEHHGALFSVVDGSGTSLVQGKDGMEYTFLDVDEESLSAFQAEEVAQLSSRVHSQATVEGEQDVPLVKKRPRTTERSAPMLTWPTPAEHGGFSIATDEAEEDLPPSLKRRKMTTLPKPISTTYLLDEVLCKEKSIAVFPPAQNLLSDTLFIQSIPTNLDPTILPHLTPSFKPFTIDISSLPQLASPTLPQAFALPSETLSFCLSLFPSKQLTLDTDSDSDQEYIPYPSGSPPSTPSLPSSPYPSPSPSYSNYNPSNPSSPFYASYEDPSSPDLPFATPSPVASPPQPSADPSQPSSSSHPAGPSSSNLPYRGVPSVPFPLATEDKFTYAVDLLQKISRQLGNLHTQQQTGFAELQQRHDSSDINLVAVASSNEITSVTSTRLALDQVRKIFTRGTPRERTEDDAATWRRAMTLELQDARRARDAAVQREMNMRALNIRLLQENNDLRRQLNQEQYLNIPAERDVFAELQAEDDNNRRMDEAAAREDDRHDHEADGINRLRAAMYLSD